MNKNIKLDNVEIKHIVDEYPDLSYLQQDYAESVGKSITEEQRQSYIKQDKERLEAYYNGHWYMLGIQAEATIIIGNHLQKITSGGLWGIESDSGIDYFKEIENSEIDDLLDQLKEMGLNVDKKGLEVLRNE